MDAIDRKPLHTPLDRRGVDSDRPPLGQTDRDSATHPRCV